jgi:putative tryptophan/tyrosine transport system substrate-binding protein
MRRREFIVGMGATATMGWQCGALAQVTRERRLAVLSPQSAAAASGNIAALRDALRQLGHIEGQNLSLDLRFADGNLDRLPALATELVAQKPAAIVAGSIAAISAARNATQTIPIVMSAIVQDPMAAGLADGLARPGRNVTGIWSEGDGGLINKRLEILKDAVPAVARVGIVINPQYDNDVVKALPSLQPAWDKLGLGHAVIEVKTDADLEPAIASARAAGVDALYVSQGPFLFARRAAITTLALRARLPSVSGYGEYAVAGGLLAYSANLPDIYRKAATFVDKIFKGEDAGRLPIERPVKF